MSIPLKNFFIRLLRLAIGIGVLAVLLWSIWSFRQYNQLPVEKVQIIATYDHITPQSLQDVISAHLTGNFFDLNVDNLKQDLLALPWVQDIFIRRKWPDTIVITIKEQQPIAQWKDIALLGNTGMLFTPPKYTFPTGLPVLFGPEESVKEVIETYRIIQQSLALLDFKVIKLHLNDQHSWQVILRNENGKGDVKDDISVFFGNENIAERLQNFITVYPKIVADNKNRSIESIDLCYKNGVAVRRRAK